LVAASVISLQYLQKQQALSEVASVKAELAAESGIAKLLAECRSESETSQLVAEGWHAFDFEDGTRANVEIRPWGMLYRVTAEGLALRSKIVRTTLIAEKPSRVFENGLVFGNPSHQVVFTGDSHVKGNIVVGSPGVTTGSLRNRRTPNRIPVDGTITRETLPQAPAFSRSRMQGSTAELRRYLEGQGGRNVVEFSSSEGTVINSGMIADSIDCVRIAGNASIQVSLVRRTMPLYIVVHGKVLVGARASLQGLVAVVASDVLTIASGISAENAIFFSEDSIIVQPNATLGGQLIAPRVIIGSSVTLRYPSLVLSPWTENPATKHAIVLAANSTVEGFVALVPSGPSQLGENLINIKPGAKVIGGVHSENTMTLDGSVQGTVSTRDFFFYEAPTSYMGWIRDGKIDRSALPKGFLLPPGLTADVNLDVLDWL
jgi:hypothetical protein